MGDAVTEIEDTLHELSVFLPTLTGILGAFVPSASGVLSLASPILAIANEVLAAIETLKTGGLSHTAATAVVGAAVTHIGQVITGTVPVDAAVTAAPVTATPAAPIPSPIPHESH